MLLPTGTEYNTCERPRINRLLAITVGSGGRLYLGRACRPRPDLNRWGHDVGTGIHCPVDSLLPLSAVGLLVSDSFDTGGGWSYVIVVPLIFSTRWVRI